jgi:hypothetical protein
MTRLWSWPTAVFLAALCACATAQNAEEEHEARAQQALADSLTDANAMMEHGSDSAKESAAQGVAQMAVETTISQPYHPTTFRNACVKAGTVERLISLIDPASGATTNAQKYALSALEVLPPHHLPSSTACTHAAHPSTHHPPTTHAAHPPTTRPPVHPPHHPLTHPPNLSAGHRDGRPHDRPGQRSRAQDLRDGRVPADRSAALLARGMAAGLGSALRGYPCRGPQVSSGGGSNPKPGPHSKLGELQPEAKPHPPSPSLALGPILTRAPSLSRCQKDLVKARAIDPLILLGTYGNDVAKAYAVAALDLLRLNNAQAYKHIVDKGGMQMLEGLKQYGIGSCRNHARDGCQRGATSRLAEAGRSSGQPEACSGAERGL